MRYAGLARAAFSLLASVCVSFAQASGSEQPQGSIQLDVVVTDSAGKPFSGLHEQDFKILDDGKEGRIASFAVYDGSNATADPPVQMILVIDCVNNGFVELAHIRQGLLKFLRRENGLLAQPTTIVRFTLSGVDFLSKPSIDGNELAGIVDKMGATSEPVGLGNFALSLNALSSVVSKVGNEPGRKMVIWLGPGWYTPVPGPHMVAAIDERGRRADYQLSMQFAKAMEEGRITLYGGYKSADFYVRDYSKPVRKVSEANPRSLALEVLAAKSGGHGDLPAIDRDSAVTDVLNNFVAEATTFYSLSLDPPRARGDDEFHELKVVLDRPGLTARTIAGYYNEPEHFRTQSKKEKAAIAQEPVIEEPGAAVPVTAAQLIELVHNSKVKRDSGVAKELERLQLTERLSTPNLTMLNAELPGTKSKSALTALADASVFLVPAAADVLARRAPDLNEQRRVMALTVDYLGKTLPRLPDFYANRTTVRYDGDPPEVRQHTRSASQGNSSWREVDSTKVVVTYRDGKEVIDSRDWGKHSSHPEGEGLIARGIFGPILSIVLVDAAHGQTTWDRWERGSAGTLAVFRYRVPENQSHYSVAFHDPSSERGETEQGTGYHGELAIDPDTGTILRLTAQADFPLGSPILEGDIMVEYGPEEIGGKTYTCPVRGVSISITTEGLTNGIVSFDRSAQLPQAILLNDVTFDEYHLFRSDARILTGGIAAPDR
jgi:VWFA-related protein